jgi:predicted phage tail component-like protein
MIINDNVRPYIVLNGVNSRSIKGLLISELAPISKPAIRVQQETIDGRDGDIVTPLGYSAYDKVIKIGLTYEYDIDEIIEFFNTSGKVVFSNEPDKYYFYGIYNQIDFERLIRFKTAEVTFHVQPFKFSDTENAQTFTLSGASEVSIRNNGNYFSRPTLAITGSGDVNLYINGIQLLTIDFGTTSRTIIIDSEAMNAYDETKSQFLNRLVSGDYDNIKLKVGNNAITFTGSVSKIVINNYSRWI